MRQHLESQFRRTPGQGRPHPSGESRDGGGSGDRRALRRRPRLGGRIKERFRWSHSRILLAWSRRSIAPTSTPIRIIPKQFLKAVVRTGLKTGLFFDWRPESRWQHEQGLSSSTNRAFRARRSWSRAATLDAAVRASTQSWALRDYGFRAVISPGFADIFPQQLSEERLPADHAAR